ncbi:MAG: efflux RND transporter periplasmic adaptor subunit [Hyphomicrobiaceae bacterium]|nr:efflux RND transporter periplasmic adaptor subunit [Hyphomicrobiaceae bacterium]
MIIFLTLCFVAFAYGLVKLKLLPDNIYVRLSPIAFMIALFLFLFVPLQWGAPAGPAVVVRGAVAIVPNVAGQVVEVAIRANEPVKKGEVLFRIDPTQYQAKVDQLAAQLKLAELREQQFTQLEARDAGSRFRVEEAIANAASLRAQLTDAKWQLESTTVRAPSDGFATNVALRPGARVATVPLAATMPFFDTSETLVGAQIHQIHVRYVKAGQKADVTFKQLPGEVFAASVEAVLPAIAQGQIAVSGFAAANTRLSAFPFVVRLKLDDAKVAETLKAGSYGQAAIYTSSMPTGHVIRRVMIWMQAWMNFIVPF